MAFSFNPGQSTATGIPTQGGIAGGVQAPATTESAPSVPDSPFLFMRNRDQEMTVNAYLQILLMVVSALFVLASVILFAYSKYLTSSIESKKAELIAKDATFKEYPLEDMKRLSKRFTVLGLLMKDYVSARSPLRFLEDVVEKQVVFNNFVFSKNLNSSGYTMSFKILTNNYRALIQQLDALNLTQYSKVVPQPKIGNLTDINSSSLTIQISAPVFVQGILSEDIVFVPVAGSSTPGVSPSISGTGTTTP
jgi:hypothetical protein